MVVDTSATEFETQDLLLNVGPQHPSTHGVFRMVLEIDGEVVKDLVPYIGYLHRGAEKLCENNDFRQGIGYMDRTEYLAAHNAELSYVMAVEALAEIEVPERAQWIRMILCELNRISSHFMFLGAFGVDVGVFGTPFIYGWRERERIIDLFEEISGDRMMFAYFRAGGLAWEVPLNFPERVREVLESARQGVRDFDGLLTQNEIFIARTKNVGVISGEEAIGLGLCGPPLRGSGVSRDLRKDEPNAAYEEFDFNVPLGTQGDTYDRYLIRMDEFRESIRIIRQAVEGLPEGPVMGKVPRLLKPPAGETYHAIESPKGELGYFLVSDGRSTNPYRFRVRPPSFCNLQGLKRLVTGHLVADVVALIGTIDIVLGEVDR